MVVGHTSLVSALRSLISGWTSLTNPSQPSGRHSPIPGRHSSRVAGLQLSLAPPTRSPFTTRHNLPHRRIYGLNDVLRSQDAVPTPTSFAPCFLILTPSGLPGLLGCALTTTSFLDRVALASFSE